MKQNPIFHKDRLLTGRSLLLPVLVTSVSSLLSVVVMINLISTYMTASSTGEIRYANFLSFYHILAVAEAVLFFLIAPALSSQLVQGERENHTMELLLSTQLSPKELIYGKLLSSLENMLILFAASLPIHGTVLIYGGVTLSDLLFTVLAYAALTLFSVSVTIFGSILSKSLALALSFAYLSEAVMAALLITVYLFQSRLPFSFWTLVLFSLWLLLFLSAVFLLEAIRILQTRRWNLSAWEDSVS